jgi:hypothetical protein
MKKSIATVSGWCKAGKIAGAFKTPGGDWLIPVDSPDIRPPRIRKDPTPKPEPFSGLSPSEIVRRLHGGKVRFHSVRKIRKDTPDIQDNQEPVLAHSEET